MATLIGSSKSIIKTVKTYARMPKLLKAVGSGSRAAIDHIEALEKTPWAKMSMSGKVLSGGLGGAAGAYYGHSTGNGSDGRTLGYGLAGAAAGIGGRKLWMNKGRMAGTGAAFEGGFQKFVGEHLTPRVG